MAMKITDDCVLCASCLVECPRGGIRPGRRHFEVDPQLCTECVDEGGSRCALACPADCIVPAG